MTFDPTVRQPASQRQAPSNVVQATRRPVIDVHNAIASAVSEVEPTWCGLYVDADRREHAVAALIDERVRSAVRENERPAAAVEIGETVAVYADRWLKSREAKVSSIRDDRSRLRDHVLPIVGPLDVATFGRDDVENVRDALDVKIASGALSWKTARNVWGTFTKMCDDMVSTKRRDLRARRDNPALGVKAPDRGKRKGKQFLYPNEVLALVSCEAVPLSWRRNAAVAAYTYLRDGELRELGWEDVDLEHATISVSHAYNRRSGASKAPKTEAGTRTVPIEPTLLPLLQAMHDECAGEGLVVALPSERTMARSLRRWLRRAGVTRDALHEPSPTRKPITWHDMRATGITWLAVKGVDVAKIQRRAGHTTMETTMGYVREAESFAGDAFGVPFPPLPASLLGGGGGGGGGGGTKPEGSGQVRVPSTPPVSHGEEAFSLTPQPVPPVLSTRRRTQEGSGGKTSPKPSRTASARRTYSSVVEKVEWPHRCLILSGSVQFRNWAGPFGCWSPVRFLPSIDAGLALKGGPLTVSARRARTSLCHEAASRGEHTDRRRPSTDPGRSPCRPSPAEHPPVQMTMVAVAGRAPTRADDHGGRRRPSTHPGR